MEGRREGETNTPIPIEREGREGWKEGGAREEGREGGTLIVSHLYRNYNHLNLILILTPLRKTYLTPGI